jgi:hypothetical protein
LEVTRKVSSETHKGHVGTNRRRRSRSIPIEVQKAIEAEAVYGFGKREIYRALERRDDLRDLLPSEKTVGRFIDEIPRRDTSAPWSVGDLDEAESELLLEALRDVIERSSGNISSITRLEAHYIVRLSQMVPGLQPLGLWRVARVYAGRAASRTPTADLDAYLAFGPWRSDEARQRYYAAIDAGWVEGVSPLDWMLLPDDVMQLLPSIGPGADGSPFPRSATVPANEE